METFRKRGAVTCGLTAQRRPQRSTGLCDLPFQVCSIVWTHGTSSPSLFNGTKLECFGVFFFIINLNIHT